MRNLCALCVALFVYSVESAWASDAVIYAGDVPASNVHGSWTLTADSSAAGGRKFATSDNGSPTLSAPLASPTDYVDVTFTAPANTAYTFWIRLQALNNSKWNDSVWVQFSDALVSGSAVYSLNSTSGLLVNLATDSTGSSDSGWGWVNGAYWMTQLATVTFASSGTHTVRVQVREDGVEFDQIVLSATAGSPGSVSNDMTIVPKSVPSYVLTDLGAIDGNFALSSEPRLNAAGATILQKPVNNVWHSFYASPAGVIDIGLLNGHDTFANSLNDSGTVAGNGSNHAFTWTAANGIVDITPPGVSCMSASSINRHGDMVGSWCSARSGGFSAWVFTGGQFYDINSLPVQNGGPWTVFVRGIMINDAGIIIGWGQLSTDGSHYFALTPAQ